MRARTQTISYSKWLRTCYSAFNVTVAERRDTGLTTHNITDMTEAQPAKVASLLVSALVLGDMDFFAQGKITKNSDNTVVYPPVLLDASAMSPAATAYLSFWIIRQMSATATATTPGDEHECPEAIKPWEAIIRQCKATDLDTAMREIATKNPKKARVSAIRDRANYLWSSMVRRDEEHSEALGCEEEETTVHANRVKVHQARVAKAKSRQRSTDAHKVFMSKTKELSLSAGFYQHNVRGRVSHWREKPEALSKKWNTISAKDTPAGEKVAQTTYWQAVNEDTQAAMQDLLADGKNPFDLTHASNGVLLSHSVLAQTELNNLAEPAALPAEAVIDAAAGARDDKPNAVVTNALAPIVEFGDDNMFLRADVPVDAVMPSSAPPVGGAGADVDADTEVTFLPAAPVDGASADVDDKQKERTEPTGFWGNVFKGDLSKAKEAASLQWDEACDKAREISDDLLEKADRLAEEAAREDDVEEDDTPGWGDVSAALALPAGKMNEALMMRAAIVLCAETLAPGVTTDAVYRDCVLADVVCDDSSNSWQGLRHESRAVESRVDRREIFARRAIEGTLVTDILAEGIGSLDADVLNRMLDHLAELIGKAVWDNRFFDDAALQAMDAALAVINAVHDSSLTQHMREMCGALRRPYLLKAFRQWHADHSLGDFSACFKYFFEGSIAWEEDSAAALSRYLCLWPVMLEAEECGDNAIADELSTVMSSRVVLNATLFAAVSAECDGLLADSSVKPDDARIQAMYALIQDAGLVLGFDEARIKLLVCQDPELRYFYNACCEQLCAADFWHLLSGHKTWDVSFEPIANSLNSFLMRLITILSPPPESGAEAPAMDESQKRIRQTVGMLLQRLPYNVSCLDYEPPRASSPIVRSLAPVVGGAGAGDVHMHVEEGTASASALAASPTNASGDGWGAVLPPEPPTLLDAVCGKVLTAVDAVSSAVSEALPERRSDTLIAAQDAVLSALQMSHAGLSSDIFIRASLLLCAELITPDSTTGPDGPFAPCCYVTLQAEHCGDDSSLGWQGLDDLSAEPARCDVRHQIFSREQSEGVLKTHVKMAAPGALSSAALNDMFSALEAALAAMLAQTSGKKISPDGAEKIKSALSVIEAYALEGSIDATRMAVIRESVDIVSESCVHEAYQLWIGQNRTGTVHDFHQLLFGEIDFSDWSEPKKMWHFWWLQGVTQQAETTGKTALATMLAAVCARLMGSDSTQKWTTLDQLSDTQLDTLGTKTQTVLGSDEPALPLPQVAQGMDRLYAARASATLDVTAVRKLQLATYAKQNSTFKQLCDDYAARCGEDATAFFDLLSRDDAHWPPGSDVSHSAQLYDLLDHFIPTLEGKPCNPVEVWLLSRVKALKETDLAYEGALEVQVFALRNKAFKAFEDAYNTCCKKEGDPSVSALFAGEGSWSCTDEKRNTQFYYYLQMCQQTISCSGDKTAPAIVGQCRDLQRQVSLSRHGKKNSDEIKQHITHYEQAMRVVVTHLAKFMGVPDADLTGTLFEQADDLLTQIDSNTEPFKVRAQQALVTYASGGDTQDGEFVMGLMQALNALDQLVFNEYGENASVVNALGGVGRVHRLIALPQKLGVASTTVRDVSACRRLSTRWRQVTHLPSRSNAQGGAGGPVNENDGTAEALLSTVVARKEQYTRELESGLNSARAWAGLFGAPKGISRIDGIMNGQGSAQYKLREISAIVAGRRAKADKWMRFDITKTCYREMNNLLAPDNTTASRPSPAA